VKISGHTLKEVLKNTIHPIFVRTLKNLRFNDEAWSFDESGGEIITSESRLPHCNLKSKKNLGYCSALV
jgi:hypothetical protein